MMLACEQGEFDSVKYLVKIWGVDVRTPATYYCSSTFYRTSTCLKTTPLFVAALHGYNSIVRYLLERGAEVSAKTSNAYYPNMYVMTPLYGAVCKWNCCKSRPFLEQQEERSAVVRSLLEFGANPNTDAFSDAFNRGRPMWMEPMCGVDAIRALIHHGLDFKRHIIRETHKTLLHHMAGLTHGFTEEDSLAIVKLLIEKGANLLAHDVREFTPLLTAANDLFDGDCRLKLAVFDFLLEREEYSLMEKIEAMELAGGKILFRAENALQFPKAFEYWRRAHQLRDMEKEASGSPTEKILGRKIGNNLEWTTLDELDQLERHPENYQIQGLLVKLRILYRFSGDGHHQVSSQYIRYLSDSTSLGNEEKFNQILDIRWGMLDQFIHHSDFFPPDADVMWKEIREDVDHIISTLSSIEKNHPSLFNFEKIKTSWDLIVQTTDSSSPHMVTDEEDEDDYEHLLQFYKTLFNQSLFSLLEMIFRLPEMPTEHNMDRLIQSLRHLEPRRLGNLLLTACQKFSNSQYYSALVRFLLEAGADPKAAVDDAGNSSLHVAARLNDPVLSEAIATLLLEKGAHPDRVNTAGQTAADVWIETRNRNGVATEWSARPEWCRTAPKLLCLASRIIQAHKIPYKDTSPATLHSDVEMH